MSRVRLPHLFACKGDDHLYYRYPITRPFSESTVVVFPRLQPGRAAARVSLTKDGAGLARGAALSLPPRSSGDPEPVSTAAAGYHAPWQWRPDWEIVEMGRARWRPDACLETGGTRRENR